VTTGAPATILTFSGVSDPPQDWHLKVSILTLAGKSTFTVTFVSPAPDDFWRVASQTIPNPIATLITPTMIHPSGALGSKAPQMNSTPKKIRMLQGV
jgi:hypothetical protein